MAEKKRKPDSARQHRCSPELNGCATKGTSNNPGPAARRMTAAAVGSDLEVAAEAADIT